MAATVMPAAPTTATGREASATDSMPHNPQPVGPQYAAIAPFRRSALGPLSHIRRSMLSQKRRTSSESSFTVELMISSLKLNPTARSSRSCGVVIMTASVPSL
jgi:hypothetical protein